jgi:putative CocE/NonD family hydrolase
MSNAPQGPSVRHDLPGKVLEIENTFIMLSDGCRIAARIWLPADAPAHPVPAILEYIPYRKRDFMRARDEPIHRYFAAHGYAAVRVDIRGSGDSEGLLFDEYSAQEHRDALEIIEWLAHQPWCDGNVGMMGISWGGFNALQVAALRPPPLKAIITLCSTDDRYADDAHYMGGCLLNENTQWGAILMTYSALPPDPQIVGERWRAMWLERLDNAVAFPELWMRHPWRDAYWRHGSVCEDYGAIGCPVYAIGGWADGYSNAVPRLLAGLSCPRKGLIGPWAHTFPHAGLPGPAIGFLQEALRWWDQWLRGVDTGIMDEPPYRVWMQESVPPQPQYEERPGRWVAEDEWPSPRIHEHTYRLNPGRLQTSASESVALAFASPQTTGMAAGEWCGFGADGEMPLDQRVDDGRSLTFEGEPLSDRVEVLGAPWVELQLSADAPVALVAVRLNDVAPDGTALRLSYGVLNLTHRRSHARPEPLEPGRRYRIRLKLNDLAHAFPAGHRIGLGLSSAYWPIAWPAPQPVTLTLLSGVSSLHLPVRPPDPADAELRPFEPPEVAPGPRHKPLRPLPFQRTAELDLASNEMVYTLSSDGGEFGGHSLAHLEEIEMDLGYTLTKRHRISDTDPLSAKTEVIQAVRMRRKDWAVRVESRVRIAAALEHLQFSAELEAYEGDELVRSRVWEAAVPRRLL